MTNAEKLIAVCQKRAAKLLEEAVDDITETYCPITKIETAVAYLETVEKLRRLGAFL